MGRGQDDIIGNCLPRECGVNLLAPRLHRTRRKGLGVSGPMITAAHQAHWGVEGARQPQVEGKGER